MIKQDLDLPEGFSSETHRDGRVTLWRNGLVAGEFPMLTPSTAIEVWAAVYEAGHSQGQKSGIEEGRHQIASELRNLLHIQ